VAVYLQVDVSDEAQARGLVERTADICLLAKTLGPDVRVNAVAPGLIDTPWFDGVEGADDAEAHVAGAVPLRRVGRPEDIAQAVHDLAHASYITGEVLLVDGGGHLLG
jgi:ketoreductase RED2